jgi:palmitoyltransferase
MTETNETPPNGAQRPIDTIEERAFAAALMCLVYHYEETPVMGQLTAAKVQSTVARTLEKTHNSKDVR